MSKKLQQMREKLIAETKKKIRDSVKQDLFIVQAIRNIEEIDRIANMLAKRMREWYSYHCPEFAESIVSNEKFAELVLEKSKKKLMQEIKVKESMGADLAKEDLKPILEIAKELESLYKFREKQEEYLKKVMKKVCPNLKTVAGVTIGAKLLDLAGSLKRLSEMPSSTIQLLGAEKALFRHMRTGAKAPKHGIIHQHNIVLSAKTSLHGKMARLLADKISIASKVDYFKGEFVGDKLVQEINKKVVK